MDSIYLQFVSYTVATPLPNPFQLSCLLIYSTVRGSCTSLNPCLLPWQSHLVFSSPVKSSFFLQNEATGNCSRSRPIQIFRDCNRTLKTGPNQSTMQKTPVQTGCNQSFVVKFIVPNKTNITSRTSYKQIDILIFCRPIKVSSNFVKIWLRYGQNRRDIHSSCV